MIVTTVFITFERIPSNCIDSHVYLVEPEVHYTVEGDAFDGLTD